MRVLLVEDDPTTSKSIQMMLSHANLNVYSTDLGEEGIDLAKLYDYDLILLDLNLPDMNGHEVLRQLRLARIETPILILSGAECRATKARGAGTPRFVSSPQTFVNKIDKVDSGAGEAARREAARELVELAPTVDERYVALPLWHLMRDPDPAIAALMTGCLEALFGRPDGLTAAPGHAPVDGDFEVWRLHLGLGW